MVRCVDMPEIRSPKVQARVRRRVRAKEIEQLAQSMIHLFGSSASGKAIEIIREQTNAGDRNGALKWHRVMSRIEELGRGRTLVGGSATER